MYLDNDSFSPLSEIEYMYAIAKLLLSDRQLQALFSS